MGLNYASAEDELLMEKFTNAFRPGYVSIKGVTMPERFGEFQKDIEDFEVFDDDVWICSFPKSGTTWTQEMVWLLVNDVDFEGAKVALGERYPFMDYTILFDYRKLMRDNQEFKPPYFLTDSIKYVSQQTRPRLIKTHLPWELLPKQIQNGSRKPKIIYVARNPKDACVSYFHHCKFLEGYTGNFEEFSRLFLSGKLCYGPYWINVKGFWERRHQPNVTFVTYEEMKRDISFVIQKLGRFLGRAVSEEQVEGMQAHLSFENMKNNNAVNYEPLREMNLKYKIIEEDGAFMRSGVVGEHKTQMAPELIAKFDVWMRKHGTAMGLIF